jgi:hypothetical protein
VLKNPAKYGENTRLGPAGNKHWDDTLVASVSRFRKRRGNKARTCAQRIVHKHQRLRAGVRFARCKLCSARSHFDEDVAAPPARPVAHENKSLKYQALGDVGVRFVTGRIAPSSCGTLAAKGAFDMTNVSNILLLDEEDLMREATALLLANRGANVTKTATIDEAISQLERQTYDVVIADVSDKAPDPERWVGKLVAKASSSGRVIVCSEKPLTNVEATISFRVLVKPYPFDRLVEAVFGARPLPLRNIRPTVKPLGRRASAQRRAPMAMRRGRA